MKENKCPNKGNHHTCFPKLFFATTGQKRVNLKAEKAEFPKTLSIIYYSKNGRKNEILVVRMYILESFLTNKLLGWVRGRPSCFFLIIFFYLIKL